MSDRTSRQTKKRKKKKNDAEKNLENNMHSKISVSGLQSIFPVPAVGYIKTNEIYESFKL